MLSSPSSAGYRQTFLYFFLCACRTCMKKKNESTWNMFIWIMELSISHPKHKGLFSLHWICRALQRCTEKKKKKKPTVDCSTRALFTVRDPPDFTVSLHPVCGLCSGLHRHLAADICTARSAWTPAKALTLFLSASERRRERDREIRVCLLQFSFHPKITRNAHISDIMSCFTISDSYRFCHSVWVCISLQWKFYI